LPTSKVPTELIRDLDPEAAQQLLDPALRHMMDAVHRFEGTVNQVLDDGIIALFGAPIAHEDHALRACYAALAMQAALQRYADEVRRTHGLTLPLRVGLNAGEVVVRTIGNDLHMDYSAVGQTTHLAARMEQLATPGSILLTGAALRLVEGLVQVNALGPVPVRGLAEPVEVFELVGASALRRRLQVATARGLTRFVGRDTELSQLRQALERAKTGHGQVVALVGEAGVGKSRLVHEYIHAHQALSHLPEQRATHEQAIDLRLALRSALQPYGDWERILAALREAETLAEALDDHRRLGRLLLFLSIHFRYMGAYDQAIVAAQRALALATASGDVGLYALANQYLGTAYQARGDYRQAIDYCVQTVAALDGERVAASASVRSSCPPCNPASISSRATPN
jgi:class 3 adenylate cyclase